MSGSYLLVASRDPFASGVAEPFYELGAALRRDGHAVTVFLVQNGVLPERRGARSGALANLAAQGVRVLADDFSLRERGIAAAELAEGVAAGPIETVVDALASGAKTLWH